MVPRARVQLLEATSPAVWHMPPFSMVQNWHFESLRQAVQSELWASQLPTQEPPRQTVSPEHAGLQAPALGQTPFPASITVPVAAVQREAASAPGTQAPPESPAEQNMHPSAVIQRAQSVPYWKHAVSTPKTKGDAIKARANTKRNAMTRTMKEHDKALS